MSPLFDKVPLELRTEIYRELLTDKLDYLEPHGRNQRDKSIKKKLHTPILRVCKQAYAEASSVLYEQNTFRFECPRTCIRSGGTSLFAKNPPPKGAFHRIQHVVISFGLGGRVPQHMCENAENITVVVKYIARLRCSLKTLLVDFRLHDPSLAKIDFGINFADAENAAANIANSLELSKALAKLEVKDRIKIAIESDNEDDCKDLANFVNKIGHLKHWVPELIEGGAHMEGDTEIKDNDEMEEDDSVEEGVSSISDDGNWQLSDANVSGLDSDSPLDSQESPSDEADVDDDIFSISDDGNGQLSDANVSGLDSDSPWDSQESPSDEADVDDDTFDESFRNSNWTRYRWTWILKPATAANEKHQPPRY